MNGLSPSETKRLVAKAFAFQAFEVHRLELLRASSFGEEGYIQEISSSCNVERSESNAETLLDYLLWFSSAVTRSLIAKRPELERELQAFAITLRKYIDGQNLEIGLTTFLTRMIARVPNHSAHTPPTISLAFEVDSPLAPPMAGRSDQESPAARRITLVFDLPPFDPACFFSIPWVLSHELWCHCLADLGAPRKVGCDPTAAFEEGWMDCVQDHIVRSDIAQMGIPNLVRMVDLWEQYILEKRKKASANVVWGSEVAEHFLAFLVRYMEDLYPLTLFHQISVDLNAFYLDQDIKGHFVDAIGQQLKVGSLALAEKQGSLFGDGILDETVVSERHFFAQSVRGTIIQGKCDIVLLFKLLKINH